MLRHRGYGEALAGAAACLLAAQGVLAQEVIRQSGFRDFARGTPGNSGANLYVSRAGRVEVINTWDLNQDGYVDLLLSNDHNVMETVDALIYWGSSQGYRSLVPELWPERPLAQVVFGLMDHPAGVTRLPSFGGGRSVIADLNRDGYPDIVFCNYIHNYPGIRTAYIYWGGPRGFQRERRTELPTNWASGVAAADLNGDGYPELVFANQGVEPGLENISPETPLDAYIYWGSATGFDVKRRTSLAAQGASDVAIADVNHDGFPDLAFTGSRPGAEGVRIFWGSRAGYSNQHFQAAPLPQPTSIRAADLDGDGFADLIVTTAGARQTIALESSATDGHGGEVYLLMGGASGVDLRRRQALPARGGRDSAAADFNHDGFPDVAVANSAGASYVYWGSKAGFSPARRTELPTLSANGVCAADLNGDGFPDLVFANSNDGQSYDVPSYIYWGSGTGFAPYLRASLQSFGAASVNAADLDGDGRPEILLVNQYSGSADSRINSRIFWGNPHHYYSSASMTTIPGHGTYDTTVADLNDDGFPDVVLSNSYADGAYVYWGGKEGFSTRRRATLTAAGGAFGSSAADLNRDGYLDLVFTRREGGKFVGTVLWGSAEGYSAARKTDLPLKGKRSLSNAIADLNRDGYLDLIFPDEYFGNLHIFWGGPDGYSEARSWSKFVSAGSLELADLNGDGYLDFVIAGGFDPQTKSRNTKTRIFWHARGHAFRGGNRGAGSLPVAGVRDCGSGPGRQSRPGAEQLHVRQHALSAGVYLLGEQGRAVQQRTPHGPAGGILGRHPDRGPESRRLSGDHRAQPLERREPRHRKLYLLERPAGLRQDAAHGDPQLRPAFFADDRSGQPLHAQAGRRIRFGCAGHSGWEGGGGAALESGGAARSAPRVSGARGGHARRAASRGVGRPLRPRHGLRGERRRSARVLRLAAIPGHFPLSGWRGVAGAHRSGSGAAVRAGVQAAPGSP